MKLYLLKIETYDYEHIGFNTKTMCNVYSTFEQAKEEGIKELKTRIKNIEEKEQRSFQELIDEEKIDFMFEITIIEDLEYAENFNIRFKYEESNKSNNLSKLEPTHKIYYLDETGNILQIFYEYRIKNSVFRTQYMILSYPEDLEEGASEKFKIGDIVKLKEGAEADSYDDNNEDRIYVVRYLPRKFNGEKYFKNTYALISLYENDIEDEIKNKWGNKELFTNEWYEKSIEKYTGVIEKDSEYDLLSRILKGDLRVSQEYWTKVKIGMLPLNLETLKKENADNWGFYSTAIPPNKTGLKVTVFAEKNIFGINIKDTLPKIRVQNKIDDYDDTFSISLEENPKVVIGENKLSKEDFEKVCEWVRNNLDILLKHFDYSNDFYDDELWEALKVNGSIKRKEGN